MKTLFLIRHAKSSWNFPELSDFERPLNKRGKRDAPFMAALVEAKGFKPDKIVSSPANRALTTAGHFAAAFQMPTEDIQKDEDIYEAYTDTLQEIIQGFENTWDTVYMFGHNPGFTSLSNRYASDFIDNVPTCGIIRIMSTTDNWAAFSPENARVTDHFFPKQFH